MKEYITRVQEKYANYDSGTRRCKIRETYLQYVEGGSSDIYICVRVIRNQSSRW